MTPRKKDAVKKNGNGLSSGFEATRWAAAAKLRSNMDANEHRQVRGRQHLRDAQEIPLVANPSAVSPMSCLTALLSTRTIPMQIRRVATFRLGSPTHAPSLGLKTIVFGWHRSTRDDILSSRRLMAVAAAGLLIIGYGLAQYWADLSFSRATVSNTASNNAFAVYAPDGFLAQDRNSSALRRFRKTLPPLKSPRFTLERVIEIRSWVRSLQSDAPAVWRDIADSALTDPSALMSEMKAGRSGACRRFAYILLGALLSDGFRARVVVAANGVRDGSACHNMTEVWLPSIRKWVLADATFDETYFVDGQPASILDLHNILLHEQEREFSVRKDGLGRPPQIRDEHAFLLLFRHIYALQTNAIFDGYHVTLLPSSKRLQFIHLVDSLSEPYPESRKDLAFLGMVLSIMTAGMLLLRLSQPVFTDLKLSISGTHFPSSSLLKYSPRVVFTHGKTRTVMNHTSVLSQRFV